MATLIVVRRNATATFQHLRETWAAKLGGDLELIWDRRTSNRRHPGDSVPVERRVQDRREADPEPLDLDEARRGERRQQPELRMPNRRRAERRRPAPETWQTLGLVLVSQNRPTSDGPAGEVIE
jgi:hypothetical protein